MSEGREDPRRGRRGRRLPVLLLGCVLVAVGASVAWTLVDRDDAEVTIDVDAPAVSAQGFGPVGTITAPEVSPAPVGRGIGARLPSPPPTPPTGTTTGSGGTGGRSWGPGDVVAYCASPEAPVGASSASGLLEAANTERARLGISPLRWSGDLASAALGWSRRMVADDEASPGMADALAHDPASPGLAENVGVAASSGGMTQARAAGTLARGWMRSSGHCRNIMNPAYTTMGAGLAVTADGTTWYGTEAFR